MCVQLYNQALLNSKKQHLLAAVRSHLFLARCVPGRMKFKGGDVMIKLGIAFALCDDVVLRSHSIGRERDRQAVVCIIGVGVLKWNQGVVLTWKRVLAVISNPSVVDL